MDNLNAGTKELISVNVEDRLDEITDLSTYTVDYQIVDDNENVMIAWTPATSISGMRVDCLVDTTTNNGWPTGHYELYIKPFIGAEAPILGPFDFNLI